MLGKAVGETVQAFQVQQAAIAQLTNSINNNSKLAAGSLKRIIDFTGQLQKKGIFGDEELQKQASYLASLGLTEAQIKATLEASAELSAKGVMPLDSAVRNMAKTFGGMAGELGEKIPALRTLTKEQLMAGDAIALVQKAFAGSLETAANTLEGRTKQVQNILGDIKEKIGAVFGVAKMAVLDRLKPVLEEIDNWLAAAVPKIINFFLNLPEIAGIAFRAIGQMLRVIFTLDFWVNYVSAVGSYIIEVFKATGNILMQLLTVLGKTLWIPLQWGFENFIYGIQSLFTKAINGILKGVAWVVDKLNTIPGINIETGGLKAGLAGPSAPDQNPDVKLIAAWKEFGRDFSATAKGLVKTTTTALGKVAEPLAPVFDEFKTDMSEVLNRELPEGIQRVLEPITENIAAAVSGAGSAATPWQAQYDANDEVFTNPMPTFLDTLKEKMGGLEGIASQFTSTLGNIAGGFAQAALTGGWIGVIMEALKYVMQGLGQVIGPLLDTLLKPLVGILVIVGRTIGQILIPVLKILEPVIQAITAVFLFAYNNVIVPVGNAIIFIFTAIYNAFAFVFNMISKIVKTLTFGLVNLGKASYQDYDELKLSRIDSTDTYSAGDEASSSSTSASASYSGQRDINVNVYIDRSAIADLRDISLLIRNEIRSAEALGY